MGKTPVRFRVGLNSDLKAYCKLPKIYRTIQDGKMLCDLMDSNSESSLDCIRCAQNLWQWKTQARMTPAARLI